jgi:hypothetical protein
VMLWNSAGRRSGGNSGTPLCMATAEGWRLAGKKSGQFMVPVCTSLGRFRVPVQYDNATH